MMDFLKEARNGVGPDAILTDTNLKYAQTCALIAIAERLDKIIEMVDDYDDPPVRVEIVSGGGINPNP